MKWSDPLPESLKPPLYLPLSRLPLPLHFANPVNLELARLLALNSLLHDLRWHEVFVANASSLLIHIDLFSLVLEVFSLVVSETHLFLLSLDARMQGVLQTSMGSILACQCTAKQHRRSLHCFLVFLKLEHVPSLSPFHGHVPWLSLITLRRKFHRMSSLFSNMVNIQRPRAFSLISLNVSFAVTANAKTRWE